MVLSGQLPLEDLLAKRSLEAVNQRLKCHVTLDLLNQQESLEYIMTRIEQAGGRLLNVFTESALELIIHAADGLPRCLNQLCDHACLLASVTASGPVTPQHVHEALEDLQKLPLHWNIPLPTRDPLTELRGGKPESLHDENKSAVISVNRAELAPSAKTPGELAPATSVIEIGRGTLSRYPLATRGTILAGRRTDPYRNGTGRSTTARCHRNRAISDGT